MREKLLVGWQKGTNILKQHPELLFIWGLVIISLCSSVWYMIARFSYVDFPGQWKLCAYAWEGIDPYPLIGKDEAPDESIGSIPDFWGTSPWGLFLGNFFYCGFIKPWAVGLTCFFCLGIILILHVSYFVYHYFLDRSRALAFSLALLCLFSPGYWRSLSLGNCGGMIVIFLFITILTFRKYRHCAGFLFGISMLKPQTAMPIVYAFFLQKRFRIVLGTLLTVFLAWGISCILLRKPPAELLYEFLTADIGGPSRYLGFLTIFRGLIDDKVIMLLSMACGMIFVTVLTLLQRHTPEAVYFTTPACLCASFWSYGWFSEKFILYLPAAASLLAFYELHTMPSESIKSHHLFLPLFASACFCQLFLPVSDAITSLILMICPHLFLTPTMAWQFVTSIMAFVLMAIGCFISLLVQKYHLQGQRGRIQPDTHFFI